MPVSHYFRNYSAIPTSEQRLMEDIVHESISMMGHNCYYIIRDHFNENDFVFGENVTSKFNRAYYMAFYLPNVQGYEGDGDYFSKFGLELRETSNFVVSRKEFEKYVPASIAMRPREGDLIYVPVLQKLFEIKFIEEELMFFSLGKGDPFIYECRAEVFRFSHENVATGIPDIDITANHIEYTIKLDVIGEHGDFNIGEIIYQGSNLAYATAKAEVKDWNNSNNDLFVINVIGEFSAGNIIGSESNTMYSIGSANTIDDVTEFDLYNNGQFKTEANNYIDFTEQNPFGLP